VCLAGGNRRPKSSGITSDTEARIDCVVVSISRDVGIGRPEPGHGQRDRGTLPESPSLAGLPGLPLQIEDASLQGYRHSVSTVGRIELGQNALHVRFDGSLGDVELGGD